MAKGKSAAQDVSGPEGSPAAAATMPAPVKKTHAAEFRRVRLKGEWILMPDGERSVCMRVVRPDHLLRLGNIPEPLAELAISVLYGRLTNEQWAQFFELGERVETALEYAESLRVVCTAALIYPRIVDDPQAEDEIHIDDLDITERRWIFDLAFLEATRLSSFRRQQETNVQPVAGLAGDAGAAEPAAGDQEQAGGLLV